MDPKAAADEAVTRISARGTVEFQADPWAPPRTSGPANLTLYYRGNLCVEAHAPDAVALSFRMADAGGQEALLTLTSLPP